MRIKSGKIIIGSSGYTSYQNIIQKKEPRSPSRRRLLIRFTICPSFINYNR